MIGDDKERTVNLGCLTWFMFLLLLSGTWAVAGRLTDIVVQLKIANCIAEAKAGELCPDAKR